MAATVVTRAPHSSAENKPLLAEQIAADPVLIHPIDLIALASDASFYRLIPKAVVLAKRRNGNRQSLPVQPARRHPHDLSCCGLQPLKTVDFLWLAGRSRTPLEGRQRRDRRQAD